MSDEDENRELDELLGELRVMLPAVTVLFAFLLTVPFTTRFAQLPAESRAAYFTAFFSTALAIVLLVAETSYHRLRGKPYDKRRMLQTASRQAVVASVLLAVALSAVVLLVADVLYPWWAALAATTTVAGLAAVLWYAVPFVRRRREE